jgi:hypothetical protein
MFILFLFIVTSAQLRSRCDVWLALKASLQTVHHVLHAASERYGRPYYTAGSAPCLARAQKKTEENSLHYITLHYKKTNSLPPVNWRWVEEGDGYVGRLQPPGQPLGVGLPSGLQAVPGPVPLPYYITLHYITLHTMDSSTYNGQ